MYIIGCFSKKKELIRLPDLESALIVIWKLSELLSSYGFTQHPFAIYTEKEWNKS